VGTRAIGRQVSVERIVVRDTGQYELVKHLAAHGLASVWCIIDTLAEQNPLCPWLPCAPHAWRGATDLGHRDRTRRAA
jgi:hypothetical protein